MRRVLKLKESGDIVYGFLDESSSLPDQDCFFCVDIVVTSQRTSKKLADILTRARRRISNGSRNKTEIKFNNSDEKVRNYVLSQLNLNEIEIVVFVVNKEGRKVADSPQNYGIVVGFAIAELMNFHRVLAMTVDKKYTNQNQESEFLKTSQYTVNFLVPRGANVFFNLPVDSTNERVIQLADFVAGAFNYKLNRGQDQYSKIIQSKVVSERIVKWTEIKKRMVNA